MFIQIGCVKHDEHIHCEVFIGSDNNHLAHAGQLTFRSDEWEAFREIVQAGSRQTANSFAIELPGPLSGPPAS